MASEEILAQVNCISEGGGHPNNDDFKAYVIALLSYIYAATGGASTTSPATITYAVVTAGGTITAGKQSVSFNNVGATNATVLGVTLKPGKTLEFSAYLDPVTQTFMRLPAIAYDGSGTELAISTVG